MGAAPISDPIVVKYVNEQLCSFATQAIKLSIMAEALGNATVGKGIAALLGQDATAQIITGFEPQGFSINVADIQGVVALANQIAPMANILPTLYKAARDLP